MAGSKACSIAWRPYSIGLLLTRLPAFLCPIPVCLPTSVTACCWWFGQGKLLLIWRRRGASSSEISDYSGWSSIKCPHNLRIAHIITMPSRSAREIHTQRNEQPWFVFLTFTILSALWSWFLENYSSFAPHLRSEERRVGKECRSRWS